MPHEIDELWSQLKFALARTLFGDHMAALEVYQNMAGMILTQHGIYDKLMQIKNRMDD